MPEEILCQRPSDILKLAPCMDCLSWKELWAVLVYILLADVNADRRLEQLEPLTVQQMLAEAACWNCTTEKQRFQALITLLASSQEELTPQTVGAGIKCLRCASDTQLQAAAMYLFCQFWQDWD